MDEGSGNSINDTVGNDYGTLYGNYSWINGSVYFSRNSSVVFPSSMLQSGSSPVFSVTAWIKSYNNSSVRQAIFTFGNTTYTNGALYVFLQNGNFRTDFAFTPGPQGTANLFDNQWHFVSATYDLTTLIIYVDGAAAGNQAMTANFGTGYNLIGSDNQFDQFCGYIADLRVFNVTLTATQIFNLYNGGRAMTTLPPTTTTTQKSASTTTTKKPTPTVASSSTILFSISLISILLILVF